MDIEGQYDKIYRYCYFKLHDRYLAQDITQETFLRFYRQEMSLDNGRELPGKSLPFLYTVARNLCIDEFRRRRFCGAGRGTGIPIEDVSAKDIGTENIGIRGMTIEGNGVTADCDKSEEWIDSMILRAAIAKLPPEEQELIFLRYVNETPVASICKISGISRFAVYRRLSKSLKWLKKELIKEGFSE